MSVVECILGHRGSSREVWDPGGRLGGLGGSGVGTGEDACLGMRNMSYDIFSNIGGRRFQDRDCRSYAQNPSLHHAFHAPVGTGCVCECVSCEGGYGGYWRAEGCRP